jgi:hypothetical protein
MAYKVVYLIKAYNILATLVINTDQIDVHIVPTRGERTWEMKWKKKNHVLRIEVQKKNYNCSIIGNLLPLQIIFTRSTIKCIFQKLQEKFLV